MEVQTKLPDFISVDGDNLSWFRNMLILTSVCEFEFHKIDDSLSQSIVSAHTSQAKRFHSFKDGAY